MDVGPSRVRPGAPARGLETQNAALRRERDQRALIAAKDERTRIAREMHDVVAHSLAVIVVQSDGAAYAARHSSAWDSEQAVTALETVAATARQALGETRALVGVRRDTGATVGPGEHPAYAPTAGIGEVVGLVGRMTDSGHPVTLTVAPGAADGVRRDVGLAVHRVVQEGCAADRRWLRRRATASPVRAWIKRLRLTGPRMTNFIAFQVPSAAGPAAPVCSESRT